MPVTILPVWLNLDYLVISWLLVLILSVSIAGYLAAIKKRSETTKLLGLVFVGSSIFTLGLVLEHASAYYWRPGNLTMIQPFLFSSGSCLTLLALLLFAYAFPEFRDDFDTALRGNRKLNREFRITLGLFALLDLALLGFTFYNSVYLQRLHSDFRFEATYTIALEGTSGLEFVVILLVLLRKTARLSSSRSVVRGLLHPQTEQSKAARAIMLVLLLPFAAVLVWILRFLYLIPSGVTAFLVWMCFTLFHTGFVVTYINHTEERAPFVVNLVAGALITILSVLSGLTFVVGRSYETDYDNSHLMPVGQTIDFRPNEHGSYNVSSAPLRFDHDLGEVVELSRGQTETVRLAFSFSFFGEHSDVVTVLHGPMIYVGADVREDGWGGYHPQPVIAPILMNLDPSAGGAIFVSSTTDRVTITWFEIPEYSSRNSNTIQLVLHSDGSFSFSYPELNPDGRFVYNKFHERTTASITRRDPGVGGDKSEPFPPRLIGIHPGGRDTPLEPIRFTEDLPYIGTHRAVLFQAYDIDYRRYIHRRMSPLAIAVVVSTLLILFAFPFVLRRSLIQPMKTLYLGMQAAGRGDLTVRVAPLYDDEIGYLSTSFNKMLQAIQDMEAERRLGEERTQEQQRQLLRADKLTSLGVLVHFVAHEINNANQAPLTNIPLLKRITTDMQTIAGEHWEEGYLVGGFDKEQLRIRLPQILNVTEQSTRQIDAIVKNLRAFSREEPTALTPGVDLSAVVESALNLAMSLAKKATNHLEVHLSRELPRLEANPVMLEQVVLNLIMNACQALPDRNHRIVIRTHSKEESVLLEVVDEGCGIPRQDLSRIKDLFFTTKRAIGGTGLGLCVSEMIIHNHRGTLDIQSVEGTGTTVVVTLPLERAHG